jgi:Zn-dependent peptidase ImmA (M78 family)
MEEVEPMTGIVLDRPDYRKAERAALALLQDMDVTVPPVDPVKIAGELGVKVWFATFTGESRNVSGYYDCEDDSIYVNRDEYGPRKTFTIAHELGHRVLHREWANSADYKVLWRDTSGQEQDAREKEANAFAANLLMPKYLMDRYIDRELGASRLATLFAVSVPAMRLRLSNLYGL